MKNNEIEQHLKRIRKMVSEVTASEIMDLESDNNPRELKHKVTFALIRHAISMIYLDKNKLLDEKFVKFEKTLLDRINFEIDLMRALN
jgi:hypothetical protein